MTDQAATAEDTFDLDELFDEQARDWPYTGARTVVLSGVTVQAHEKFGEYYDDSGSRVDFKDARDLDKDNLPVGYEFYPNVEIVLNMVVEDKTLPEPQYPPTVRIGTTRGVEIIDPTHFRFIKQDGTVRNPSANSLFKAFIASLIGLGGQSKAQLKPPALVDGDKVWSTEVFEGLALVFDAHETEVNGQKKTRAWPIGLAGGATTAAAPSGNVTEALLKAAQNNAGDAKAFRNAAMAIKGIPADQVARLAGDPDTVLAEVLASA